MLKKQLSLLAAVLLLLVSCKKDFEDFDRLDEQAAVDAPYLPLAKGTQWISNLSAQIINDGAPFEIVSTITGKKVKIDGQVLYECTETSTANPQYSVTGYLGYNNGVYSGRAMQDQAGTMVTTIYYDENQPIGQKVYNDYKLPTDDSFKMRYSLETVEKDITKTVRGVTYNDVVHTRVVMETNLFVAGEWSEISTIDYYFAKNVGPIANYTTAFGIETTQTELVTYKKAK